VSHSKIEGSVDAIAQRIYHRIRRRIQSDRSGSAGKRKEVSPMATLEKAKLMMTLWRLTGVRSRRSCAAHWAFDDTPMRDTRVVVTSAWLLERRPMGDTSFVYPPNRSRIALDAAADAMVDALGDGVDRTLDLRMAHVVGVLCLPLRAVIAKPLPRAWGASAARVADDMLSSGGGAGGWRPRWTSPPPAPARAPRAVARSRPARPELLIAI